VLAWRRLEGSYCFIYRGWLTGKTRGLDIYTISQIPWDRCVCLCVVLVGEGKRGKFGDGVLFFAGYGGTDSDENICSNYVLHTVF